MKETLLSGLSQWLRSPGIATAVCPLHVRQKSCGYAQEVVGLEVKSSLSLGFFSLEHLPVKDTSGMSDSKARIGLGDD